MQVMPTTHRMDRSRRLVSRIALLLMAMAALSAVSVLRPAAAQAAPSTVSKSQAIIQLRDVRRSIDSTLALMKAGKTEQAFTEAKAGYLTHFELVEVPLRVADNRLTIDAEGRFAEIRQAIRSGDSTASIRTKIVDLRAVIDDAERALTNVGVGAPAVVAVQSFIIIFREGFEIVLLLSVLLGYLEAARSTQFMRPIMAGAGAAVLATALTVVLLRTVFTALPISMEVLEGVTALLAVVMLFYVSFWLISRLEHKRWMEFLKARMWNAVSVGSFGSLMLVGFTAVYREGFETALFYQSLLSFGSGLMWAVLAGLGAGLVALAAVAVLIFRFGRKLNIKVFMNTAVALVMLTSVAFLGNAVHSLQSADVISYHVLSGFPQMPIFLAQALGFWGTWETILSQGVLFAIYAVGAMYVFMVKPRLIRRQRDRAIAGAQAGAQAGTRAVPSMPAGTARA